MEVEALSEEEERSLRRAAARSPDGFDAAIIVTINELRARLAAAETERDEAKADAQRTEAVFQSQQETIARLVGERATLRAEATRLQRLVRKALNLQWVETGDYSTVGYWCADATDALAVTPQPAQEEV